jgi:hypothetical protein
VGFKTSSSSGGGPGGGGGRGEFGPFNVRFHAGDQLVASGRQQPGAHSQVGPGRGPGAPSPSRQVCTPAGAAWLERRNVGLRVD